jgi:hypothetical protein
VSFQDSEDPDDMFAEVGKTGFVVHHKTHYLDRFRAGWEGTQ